MVRKRILLAVDGSEHSYKVLDEAIEYAKLLDAEVVFVYCHEKYPEILGEPYRDREILRINNATEELVRPFLQRLESENIPVEERLMEEPAGKMICDVAEIEKCDLIIMGSRGLSNFTSLIVGSVTNSVLQAAPCSVLVVR
jgi:nucleotide-binding universal stress UspA family protein